MNTARPLPPGTKIGDFEITRYLARGGMGMVYLARQRKLNRDVALKILYPELARDPEFAERFQREALAMAALPHPNIVTIYDSDNVDGMLYIAMQYVPGGTVQGLIEQHKQSNQNMPIAQITQIMRQVSEALSYAHSKGLVHRDIKPSNILCDAHGRYLLTDFGIALDNSANRLSKTDASSGAGTAEYMSPEQARNNSQIDHRSDIYSLGVLLYCMLSNRPPFTDSNPLTVLYRQVNESPPTISGFRRDLTPELKKLLDKTLPKDPAARFQRVAEMIAVLDGGATRTGIPSWVLPASLVAGGAVLLGLLVWVFERESPGTTPVPTVAPTTAAAPALVLASATASASPVLVTDTPAPTQAPVSGATATLFVPSATPPPTDTPIPTLTPVPTVTRVPPTRVPATRVPPTATPLPPPTEVPTAVPQPQPQPQPQPSAPPQPPPVDAPPTLAPP
jgi:eukaryotic-like serine/threonine-protein kinase